MTYSEMKDSGVFWIGGIPCHWTLSKMASLYSLRSEKVSDKEYPPLSVTMRGVVPQLATAAKTDDGDNRKLVRVGDFAINSRSDRRGSCGISAYEGSVSLINTVLIPRNQMNPEYYNWLFHSELFADEFYRRGHGIVDDLWTTNWQEMKRMFVPVPPLQEQQSIATYLNAHCAEIDAIIAEAKASIEEYKRWKASVIYQAVTKGLDPDAPMKDSGVDIVGTIPKSWEMVRLRFLCDTMTGNQDTQNAVPDGKYPFYVRSPIVERANTFTFEGESVLMAGDGAGAGKVFHHATGKYAIHQRVYCFYNFRQITPQFFFYYMRNLFSTEIDKGSAKSTVPSVRLPMLLDFRVSLPNIQEQIAICEFLDGRTAQIDSVISEKQSIISELESYKKSLIYEAVTGKRKVG